MPTLNQAAFLEAAVESVFAQDEAGVALWVQDGGSTDGTQALLAELAQRHKRLAWVSEPDGGPADALNRAFAQVVAEPGAELFGWLNSDDLQEPGALARVRAHLAAHPDHVAVYGEGLHIDAAGTPLGRYPTGLPDRPLSAWADGCPVCQPTMWLRPEALRAILPLDATLRAAFDFHAWFRLCKAFPGRIGHIDAVQARSRLHDQGITLSQRGTVALEGLQVLHRHLGAAPAHWLLTWGDELLASLPDGDPTPVALRQARMLADARPWLSADDLQDVAQRWRAHRGLALATPHCAVDVMPDGWMGPSVALRVRSDRPLRVTLHGRHEVPQAAPLTLRLEGADAAAAPLVVARRGPLRWTLDLPATGGRTRTWRLLADPCFVPARSESGSTDTRELAWQLDRLGVEVRP
jgi:hypothetical protein